MFNSIARRNPKYGKFDLSHEYKMSGQMGKLYPVLVQEIVPGDKFRVNSEIMLRLAPMVSPVMHRVNVFTHYFFVPNRIIWDEWEDFITGGEDGTEAPVHPHYRTTDLFTQGVGSNGDLPDYMGIPKVDDNIENVNINALPFRAYHLIWNEWYRDQNLQDPTDIPLTSGQQTTFECLAFKNRCWEKDYLTSALPWPQRGDAVTVPSQITYETTSPIVDNVGNSLGTLIAQSSGRLDASSPSTTIGARVENLQDIGIDINDLRRSNAIQRFLELSARAGSRYKEHILAFFGVKTSDGRLQRPEFLGGGKQAVMISEVLQTAETDPTGTPQGNMAGHGVSVGTTNRFEKTFEEHGFVIGIMSVLPVTAYQEGVERFWTRSDKFDYYNPMFAHIGEQEVKNKEVFFDGSDTNDPDGTWGYQSRYAEYKYKPSTVHGEFRDSLDHWHMGRVFGAHAPLSSGFVQSNPTQRIFADTDANVDKLYIQIYHNISALRKMPYYSDPRL
jgi:hypothetical protein